MQSDKSSTKAVLFPNRIGWCIKKYGYTYRELADEIGISRKALYNYISGYTATPKYTLEKIAKTLDCSIEELRSSPLFDKDDRSSASRLAGEEVGEERTFLLERTEQSIEENDDMNRRKAMQIIGITGVTVARTDATNLQWNSPLWERLSRALKRTSYVDETALNSLEQISREYWRLRKTLGYRSLVSGFLGHFETVTELLQYSQPSSTHHRLCSLASEIAQYIGATLFDMNEYATAQSYYSVSIEAAEEAENFALLAIGLGRMSSLPIYREKARHALPLLQKAQQVALQHSTFTIRSWLASVDAEAHANLQDAQACLNALSHSGRLTEQIETNENPYDVHFDYSRFLGYKGVCHLRLQQPKEAFATLSEAANLIDFSSLRQRSIILADTAHACSQLGEIDEACKFAGQSLAISVQIQSEIVLQRLLAFHDYVTPWNTMDSVRELNDQMMGYSLLTTQKGK